jgi:hypothetical protein
MFRAIMSNEGHHNTAPPAETAPDSGASSGGMSKVGLIVACLVLATTVAECVAAFLYLPGAAPPTTVALDDGLFEDVESAPAKASDGHHGADKGKHKADKGGDSKHKANKHGDETLTEGEAKLMAGLARKLLGDCQEMDLGEFRVTAYQPVSNTTLRLDFHIYGAVFNSQADEFASVLNAKKQRFRDQVITMVRTVDMADFTEAGLGLIKRRILETTNKTFGKPYLQSVIFSEFSFVEQ